MGKKKPTRTCEQQIHANRSSLSLVERLEFGWLRLQFEKGWAPGLPTAVKTARRLRERWLSVRRCLK